MLNIATKGKHDKHFAARLFGEWKRVTMAVNRWAFGVENWGEEIENKKWKELNFLFQKSARINTRVFVRANYKNLFDLFSSSQDFLAVKSSGEPWNDALLSV